MARLVLRRSSFRQFFGPTALYAVGCGVALVIAWAFGAAWLPVLFLAGMTVILLTWRQVQWPDTWSRYLSLGAVLLLMCATDRVFYIADYFVTGPQFDQWPFFVEHPQTAVFKAEIIAILGPLLTILAWRQCGGLKVSPGVVMERPKQTYRVVQIIYVMALVGMFATERIPRLAAMAGQLLPTLLGLGLVSTFLLPMARLRRASSRLIATVLLSLPFMALASSTGMKENIILAVIPSGVMAWRWFRHPLARASMIAAGLVALALITSYVNLYRAEVWTPQNYGLPISDSVPQDFVDQIKTDGMPDTVAGGLEAFIHRSDASFAHGWAVSIADEQALHPRMVLGPLVYVFIPRIAWPGKPLIQVGWEYSGLVFGQRYMSQFRSSTAAGFYPGLYLGAGWPAVVIGALLAGALLAGMTRLALKFGGSLAAGLYIFSLLPFMLRMNENWPDGVLAGPVITLVYLLVIVSLAKVIARVAFPSQRTPATSP